MNDDVEWWGWVLLIVVMFGPYVLEYLVDWR